MLGYTTGAYYKSLKKQTKQAFQTDILLDLIKQKRKIWKKGSGRNLLKSLETDLNQHNIKIGRDRFFAFLKTHSLQIKRRKLKPLLTNSRHRFYKYPNLIKELEVSIINQLWVSDMTYIYITSLKKYAYLFLITDVFNREIIGYCLSLSPTGAAAIKALKQAFKNRGITQPCAQLYHHSDRGYCYHKYTQLLEQYKIQISMAEKGDARENAIAERVNGIIKGEFTDGKTLTLTTFKQGQQQLKTIIQFYNKQRPHGSIERMTPLEAKNCTHQLKRLWKNYYKESSLL